MSVDVTTVADDLVVIHRGGEQIRFEGLDPDTAYVLDGVEVTTLPRPPGERLATIATVNDLHLGERVCGRIGDDGGPGPIFRSEPGDPPYPDVMNEAAAAEIADLDPDAVVVKGDLTDSGRPGEFLAFDRIWGGFGTRLHWILGNHDTSGVRAPAPDQVVHLPGATIVVLETARPGRAGGTLDPDQLDLLDETCRVADRPVLAMGHHPIDGEWFGAPEGEASFLLDPEPSEALAEVADRRRTLVGWFAGHTHRNLVRPLGNEGALAVEVSSVKDFPGVWAEYRVFEGGIEQVVHRIGGPAALAWSERTREMMLGHYGPFALGQLSDRCLVLPSRCVETVR